MAQKKSILVACAIIEKCGKILAAKRRPDQPHGGFWEFPGGKIHPDEDPKQAVVREIKEELDADIVVLKPLAPARHGYPDKQVTLVPFVCKAIGGGFTALEHEKIRWVDRKEAPALLWLPPDREILQNYLKDCKFKNTNPDKL